MPHITLLHRIRRARGFSRGVTILIVLALIGLTAERTIRYLLEQADVIEAQTPVEQLQQRAPRLAERLGIRQPAATGHAENTRKDPGENPAGPAPAARLSATLIDLRQALGTLKTRLDQGLSHTETDARLHRLHRQLLALNEATLADFAAIDRLIKTRRLPAVIQQRQDRVVATYQQAFQAVEQQLQALTRPVADDTTKLIQIEALQATLDRYRFQRSPQPFDPDQLPTRSLQPAPDNRPRLTPDAFTRAGLYNHPYPRLAALGDFTFDRLPDASNPAYLAESDEIVLTQAIRDQAAALNHDPVQIYQWVRNTVEWLPTWGAIQNADLTLSSRRGNAMDIASLTIALLRASRIPARYVHGTIDVPAEAFKNWAGGFDSINAAADYASAGGIPITTVVSGGKISKIRLEHVWVEAAIDYYPSRGAKNRDADSWVQLDPGFKQYDYLPGLDAVQISGIDPQQLATDFTNSGTINEAEGWVTGFDPQILQSAQNQAQTALEDYITNNLQNPTVGDVVGGRKTIVQDYPVLPSSLPNRIVTEGARYDKLPADLQQTIGYSFNNDPFTTFPWSRLNNEKVTLSFTPATPDDEAALQALLPDGPITDISQLPGSIPAYLIQVIPELKVNGETVKTGSPMGLGEELDFITDIRFAGRGQVTAPRTFKAIAGSYLAVNVVAGSVSPTKLTRLQSQLTATRAALESNDPAQIQNLTREDLLGDLFYSGTLGYYAQLTALATLAGLQQGGHFQLAAGHGTIGYEPNVDTFFGIPRSIQPGGVSFDIPIIQVTQTNDGEREKTKQFNLQVGVLSSALEHATPEQLFNTDPANPADAISAVKALAKASAAGQRIYQITQANQAGILPNIHHDEATMAEISASLNAGKIVITHTDAVSIPGGWSGAGYIILDPETNVGAWKIGGGVNGGFIFWFTIIFLALVIISSLFTGTLLITGFALIGFFDFINKVKEISKAGLMEEQMFKRLNEAAAIIVFAVAGDIALARLGAFGGILGLLLGGFLFSFDQVWF